MGMNKHVSELMSAYVNEELDSLSRRRVDEHIESCRRCRTELDQVRIGAGLASTLNQISPNADIRIRFNPVPVGSRRRIKPGLVWFAVSCVLLGLLAIGVFRQYRKVEFKEVNLAENSAPSPLGKTPEPVTGEATRTETPRQKSQERQAIDKPGADAQSWELTAIAGSPKVASQAVNKSGRLAKGQWVETDDNSRAKLAVASIGFVDIGPNTKLRLVESSDREHRINLARGKISAFILAPPRVFLVDTPSATAVDLGCAYTLDVDDKGTSTLRVTSGWVSFVLNGRESFVPAGASCVTRPGLGVSTPVFEDASQGFQRKLALVDFGKPAESDIRELLAEARQKDSLTLWHLLGRSLDPGARTQIFDFLEKAVPPPSGVTREGILNANPKMLSIWWEQGIRQTN